MVAKTDETNQLGPVTDQPSEFGEWRPDVRKGPLGCDRTDLVEKFITSRYQYCFGVIWNRTKLNFSHFTLSCETFFVAYFDHFLLWLHHFADWSPDQGLCGSFWDKFKQIIRYCYVKGGKFISWRILKPAGFQNYRVSKQLWFCKQQDSTINRIPEPTGFQNHHGSKTRLYNCPTKAWVFPQNPIWFRWSRLYFLNSTWNEAMLLF